MRSSLAVLAMSALIASSTTSAAEPATQAPDATGSTTTVVLVAQTPKPAPPEKMGRELNGYLFLPSHLIDDPFSYTAFGLTFGLGSGNALGPSVQLTPPPPVVLPGGKWYGFTGLGVGLVMDVRFLEYLSARAALNTIAYLGTGNGAVIAVGSTARITGSVGVKGSLPVGNQFRFAASFDMNYGPVYSLLIAQGAAGIVDACLIDPQNCQVDLRDLLQSSNTVTYIGGLAGSWAPLPYLGFTVNGKFIAPTKTGKASISQNGTTFAFLADFDAKPLLSWLPLGLNAVYSVTSPIGSNGVTTTQDYGVGLYYTGRPNLALGLEIDWRKGRLESQQVSDSTLAWINFRYYWN
jgi:hypothetical protein